MEVNFSEDTNCTDCWSLDPTANDIFTDFIVSGVLMIIVGILGIMGNIFSLVILCRKEMRSSINFYLCALGVYDTALIVTAILVFSIPSIYAHTGHMKRFISNYPYIIKFLYPIALFAQTGSIWATVSVTIERYIAICHPLQSRSMCTIKRAKYVISVVFILSLIYNMPRFWEVDVLLDNTGNSTRYWYDKSDLRRNEVYVEIYYVWLYLPIMYFLPFLVLTVFNLLIIRRVRKAYKDRQKMTRYQEKEMHTALMLICIVVIFIVCNTGAMVISVMEVAGFRYNNIIIVQLSNFMVTFNSSVNFIIYFIFGRKFRFLFLKIICFLKPEQTIFSRTFARKSWYGTSMCDYTPAIEIHKCPEENPSPEISAEISKRSSSSAENTLLNLSEHAKSRMTQQQWRFNKAQNYVIRDNPYENMMHYHNNIS